MKASRRGFLARLAGLAAVPFLGVPSLKEREGKRWWDKKQETEAILSGDQGSVNPDSPAITFAYASLSGTYTTGSDYVVAVVQPFVAQDWHCSKVP